MSNLIRYELFKVFKSATIRILAVIMVGLSVMRLLIASLLNEMQEIMNLEFSNYGSSGLIQAFADFSDAALYIAVICAVLIINDITSQSIKNTVISIFSRGQIFTVKYIITLATVTVLMLIYSLIMTLGLTSTYGWGEPFSLFSLWDNYISVFLLGILILNGLVAFISFLSYLTKNTVFVILIIFGTSLVVTVLTYLNYSNNTAFLDFLNKIMYSNVLTNYNRDKSFANIIYILLSSSFMFFPFFIGGYMLFRRQEIK